MSKELCVLFGANGFVGSHLVDRLSKERNLMVRAFDRFRRDPQFALVPNVTLQKGDVTNESDVAQALKGATYVIHCFSPTTPFVSDADPYADIHNLLRSVRMFEQCVEAGVKKVVFISSGGAVYGRLTENRVANEMDAPMPVSPYGICKLSLEHYLEYFKRKHGLAYVAYRITNPYGPRQIFKQQQGVIPSFLHHILHGNTIPVFGDGSASRDYIYIEDAVDMIARTFRRANRHSVYNIGSGSQISVKEIIESLGRLLSKEPVVAYKDEPKTFLRKTDISIDRFCREFGKPDFTPFAQGLERTIQAYPQIGDHAV